MKLLILPHVAALMALAALSSAQRPFVTTRWTADPSAHVFEGRLFLYASHDIDAGIPSNDVGDHFAMRDYYVYSMDEVYGAEPVTDHGVILALEDIPWASRQLWAPDAAYKDGKYFFYFPARDLEGRFRIGVAVSDSPAGLFTPDESFIPDTFSIDPASFVDWDGQAYLLWGGIHGGELQCWQNKTSFDESWIGGREPPPEEPALSAQIALLSKDMHKLAEGPQDVIILAPETGEPILAGDEDRRFFEGPWVHRRGEVYYLVYSTGTTHYLVYATSDNPYGPYTYRGRLLEPVEGWTTHGSIVEYEGQNWLFYHDSEASGATELRQVKAKKIWFKEDGEIIVGKPCRFSRREY